ncbi:hypothetical protein DI487_10215 [Flavobacterium sediminis]|uniref:Immunity MXAN-0049 protein domain-containing protein n=1 Tax=Flavobacterium sediminis TaxID=2201181 RepID=A0A2U8QVF4_9FLAO|nr:DUF1629 domain-containing protein [Flavobacterium sediminis]AWM14177.1 hypothetical protein DI487_10170 [Flavobacterium sediminis]AWM14186.1 hypothetical protein DI487_10215 [Flavobacterium sediminis]
MQYYILDTPAESKETGKVYPQVAFDKIKEAFKFRHNVYPDNEPILSATLEKGAKLTDILSQASIAGHGLLINDKVKNILADFKIMNHKFYNCPVKDHKGVIHQYYWMALVQPDIINWIDFKNSSFYTVEVGFREDNIKLTSYQDYIQKKEELPNINWWIEAENIKINTIEEHDLFVFPYLFSNIILSEKLTQSFIKDNIKGIKFEKAPVNN